MSVFTFRPTDKPDPLAEFRAMCREIWPKNITPHIRTITGVGARLETLGKLSFRDRLWMRMALKICERAGAHVSEDFEFTVKDITMERGRFVPYQAEHDFLNSAVVFPTDLLVICFVHKPQGNITEEGIKAYSTLYNGYRTSPLHFVKNSWRDAALRAGAKIIVTIECNIKKEEITIRDFNGPEYIEGPAPSLDGNTNIQSLIHENFAKQIFYRGPPVAA
jgi:hypothetical protein